MLADLNLALTYFWLRDLNLIISQTCTENGAAHGDDKQKNNTNGKPQINKKRKQPEPTLDDSLDHDAMSPPKKQKVEKVAPAPVDKEEVSDNQEKSENSEQKGKSVDRRNSDRDPK